LYSHLKVYIHRARARVDRADGGSIHRSIEKTHRVSSRLASRRVTAGP